MFLGVCYKITQIPQEIRSDFAAGLFSGKRRSLLCVSRDELCAVDSTSISTYGFNRVDIRWGKNKEHLPLRQTLEGVVYSLTSHMPIYYKELPGNMPDCRTIELIMKELEHAGFKNLVLITDRGYDHRASCSGGYLPLHHSGIMIFQPTLVAGESTFYFS